MIYLGIRLFLTLFWKSLELLLKSFLIVPVCIV